MADKEINMKPGRYDRRRTCEWNHRRLYANMTAILENMDEIPEGYEINCLKHDASGFGWTCFACLDTEGSCGTCPVKWDGRSYGNCQGDYSIYTQLVMALQLGNRNVAIHYAKLIRDIAWGRKSRKMSYSSIKCSEALLKLIAKAK